MGLRHEARVAAALAMMRFRTQMEYRAGFFLDRVAQIVAYGATFGALWVLLNRFGTLGDWSWPELALLLSFHLLGYAMGASLSFVQMRDLEDRIARGGFDAIMVKPVSPWTYVVFEGINIIGYSGHILLAALLMVWALTQVPVPVGIGNGLFLVASLVSAAMIIAAMITMIGATAIGAVRSKYLYSVFFGVWELARYPLTIFPIGIVVVLLTVFPMGYVSFVPVAVFLGKDVPLLGPLAGVLSLAVGPLLALLANLYWRRSILSYQGAGG